MKRVLCICLSALVFFLGAAPALALETAYQLDMVYGRLTLDNEWFSMVLTPARACPPRR